MAAAEPTTPNEIFEKEAIKVSSEMKVPIIPVPAQRKNKVKAEEPSEKINKTLSVSAIIDNSRVVFLENDITKKEVLISEESNKLETVECVQTSVSNESTEYSVKSSQSNKSKVASFIEKFNSNSESSRSNVVICQVEVCNPINIPPENNKPESTETNDKSKENRLSVKEIILPQDTKSPEENNSEALPAQTITPLKNTAKMKEENESAVDNFSPTNNGNKNDIKVLDANGNKELTEKVTEFAEESKDIKVPIPAPRNLTLRNKVLESEIVTANNNTSVSLSNSMITNTVTNVKTDCLTTQQIVKDISTSITAESNNSTSSKNMEETHNQVINNKCKVTNSNSQECENNKLLSQTKPTISKKPSTLNDYRKSEKTFVSGKIPIFEKSLSFQDRDLKVKGLRSPAERNMEFEPKLTKKQRTSSEQCLSLTKGDNELSMIRKLRAAVEQLQQENAVMKKLLESERSAFREQRAVFEAESRKEKAEAKRREASLESQLRTALKGQTSAAVGPTGAVFDNARYMAALESAKTTIKSLQEKLRVALDADKRKAAELRAQHDAHTVVVQQMERDARAQTAKLLEELKTKDRQVEKVKKDVKGMPSGGGKSQSKDSKMAVAEQLHQMEGQISRLENEIQRRDDIIQTLRTSKIHRERRFSQRLSKDNIFKDILSDVDSAVSSAPNSLSPQPSPDLWYSHVEVDEGLLEAAKKQIQELEKALNLSTAGQKQAQLKVSQLEEQLQDLREHADLLEFRCLELEDSAEKRHSLEELTDSDSGCTSPENRLKNSVSPQLRRSDSGYKSPTRSASPNIKNQRRLLIPPSFPEQDAMSCAENYKAIINNLHLQSLESIFENGYSNDEIKDRLEGMMLRTHSESDRICLEQVLQLLWNLQALGNSLNDEDFSMVKSKKIVENDLNKCDFDQQTKSGKIIATVSPYSQKALNNKSNDLIKTVSNDEVDLANFTSKQESKKILFGLQESGIFEEGDWENKSTQTDCYDCVCPEPESDLATEVLRLNQIREQLEKSGAIKNKNAVNVCNSNSSPIDLKQQRRRDKKKIELYESRIVLLENKLSIYESSDDVRQKKLAQRLQREADLQSKVKNLEFDLSKLKKKYIILEEERCEFEEAENDTRLHCQELEAEFDILTAKLRDLDDQRSCARNEAECYRQLVEEYEYKIMTMQQHEKDLMNKSDLMEKLVPVLVSYNMYSLLEELTARQPCCGNVCNSCDSSCGPAFAPMLMLEYPDGDLKQIGEQLSSLANQANSNGSGICGGGKMSGIGPQHYGRDDKSSQFDDNTTFNSGNTNQNNGTGSGNLGMGSGSNNNDEVKMKMRIEELEKRELVYLETLTKGDEMWAEMETGYKHKLKELEENEEHLVTSLNKWKAKVEEKEKKIHEMEENEEVWRLERKAFMEDLREVKKIKDDLEKKNSRLQSELVDSRHHIEEKEKDYQLKVSMVKSKTESLKNELDMQKRSSSEMEIEHKSEVVMLKKDLRRTAEELNQYKESVRELTEVVKTLRENLTEIEYMMSSQKIDYEEKSKAMLTEIRGKSEEVELLRSSLAQLETLPSAKDELENFTDLRERTMSPTPVQHHHVSEDIPPTNNTTLLPVIPPTPQVVSHVPVPNNNVQGTWDEQVTTLITIKAIKSPGTANPTIGGPCYCADIKGHSPVPNRKGYQSSYYRESEEHTAHNSYKKDKGKVNFNDCDILYGTNSSKIINDSDINLFDASESTASVPFEYRAKKSPESVDVTSGARVDDGRKKCTCKSQNNNDLRDRTERRSNSSGRNSKDGVSKPGDDRRACSCSRSCGCNNPPVSCYCCGCKQTVDKTCNKHRPIPLLLLTKTTDALNQQNKPSNKSPKLKPKGKKENTHNEKKIASAQLTSEKATSYCDPDSIVDKSTSYNSNDLYGNMGTMERSTSYENPSSLITNKKPEIPSRKPKLPKGKPPKPGDKKGNKKDDVLRLPPLHLKENVPTENLEHTMCKMLCESLESCLDERTYIVCQQLVGDVRNVLDFAPEEPQRKTNLLNTAIEKSIGDNQMSLTSQLQRDTVTSQILKRYWQAFQQTSMPKYDSCTVEDVTEVNKLEAVKKEQQTSITQTESHNDNIDEAKQHTESSTPPTNKIQTKANASSSSYVPCKNNCNKVPPKDLPGKRNRIERLCMNNKKDFIKNNVTKSSYVSPKAKSCDTSPTKLSPYYKNRKTENSMLHFESNIKLVQECSVSYETCKNIKRVSNKKPVTKPKTPPPAKVTNLPKVKASGKKSDTPNEINPFMILSPLRIQSSENDNTSHDEMNTSSTYDTCVISPNKEAIMKRFIDEFLAAPLTDNMRIDDVCNDIIDPDIILNESNSNISDIIYTSSGIDIEEDDDKSMNYVIEIINKPSESRDIDKGERHAMSPIPEASSKSNESKLDMIFENTAANNDSFSKMSLALTDPSSKYLGNALTKTADSSIKNSRSKFIFSGRCYSAKGNSCGVKSLPLVTSKGKSDSTNKISQKDCRKKCFSLTTLPTAKGNVKETMRKPSVSLDMLEMNKSRSVALTDAVNIKITAPSTTDTARMKETKYFSADVKEYCNNLLNLKKHSSLCCIGDSRALRRTDQGNVEHKDQESDCKRTLSESELSMRKLKLFTQYENEHIAISNLIEKLHTNGPRECLAKEQISEVKLSEEIITDCGSSDFVDVKEELFEESTYETSSKEVFSLADTKIKKSKRFKTKRKFPKLSSRKTRTKVTIKMRKSHVIRGKMFFNDNLTGVLSKINAEIVSAVGMVDRETVNVLSNVSVQLSDTLFKMKALQENTKKVLEMASQTNTYIE